MDGWAFCASESKLTLRNNDIKDCERKALGQKCLRADLGHHPHHEDHEDKSCGVGHHGGADRAAHPRLPKLEKEVRLAWLVVGPDGQMACVIRRGVATR